ncbi:TetR/AcrR family transcriptional regulator [Streptomyces sp. NPDC091212]|uniref:TetR/AcrR family transcriptional regulator n=1 Tax=Streptomyces sp. NPDC091212 TaxID=3155191 RepID=UPI003438D30D
MARTGRPRQFDPLEATDAALRLFWQYGYESTSVAQLRGAMGISVASFYAAFSSKDQLFDAVVQRYLSTFGQVTAIATDQDLPPREAVERTLRQSVHMQTDPSHPSGCLVALAETTGASENQRVRDLLADRRAWDRRNIEACVERGVVLGDLSAGTDAGALAAVFHSFLLGVSTQARDGLPAETLDAAVTHVMRVWDSARAGHNGQDPGRCSGRGPDR